MLKGGTWATAIQNSRCVDTLCTVTDADALCRMPDGRVLDSGLRVVWPVVEPFSARRAQPTPSPTPTSTTPLIRPRNPCSAIASPCRSVTVPAEANDREEWMCIKSDAGGQVRVTASGPDLPVDSFNICIHRDDSRVISAACKDTVASASPKDDGPNSRTAVLDAQPGNSFRVILRNDSNGPATVNVTLDNAIFYDDGCR